MTKGVIKYEYPYYTDHTLAHGGFLAMDRRAHACFHYYLLCQKLLERAGHEIEDQRFRTFEGQLWMDKPYGNIAVGTAIRYGLESPSDFLQPQFKYMVEQECIRMKFPSPANEYWEVEPGKVVTV